MQSYYVMNVYASWNYTENTKDENRFLFTWSV